MNRLIILAAAFAVAAVGQVSARAFPLHVPPADNPKAVAGIVFSNGDIKSGTGFAVQHLAVGDYQVTFRQGFFPTGCAAMIVQTWGRSPVERNPVIVGTAHVTGCGVHDPIFHIHLRATDGVKRDDDFQFIAVGV